MEAGKYEIKRFEFQVKLLEGGREIEGPPLCGEVSLVMKKGAGYDINAVSIIEGVNGVLKESIREIAQTITIKIKGT